MSWQSYVDTNLVGTGNVSSAAIVGHKGGVWASSPGFTVSGHAGRVKVHHTHSERSLTRPYTPLSAP